MVRDSFYKLYGSQKYSTRWSCGTSFGRARYLVENNSGMPAQAWFTLVRDPVERFLSAAGEMYDRRMPHPPVRRLAIGSDKWVIDTTTKPPPPPPPRRRLPGSRPPYLGRVPYSTYYPTDPAERIGMIVSLVTELNWSDVHFRSQWSTVRHSALRSRDMIGYVGETCNTTALLALLSRLAREHDRTEGSMLKSDSEVHSCTKASERSSKCIWTNRKLHCVGEGSAALTCENFRRSRQSAILSSEQVQQVRLHYAADYECLGLPPEPACDGG